VIGYKDLSEEA